MKLLVNPFAWYLALQAAGLFVLWRRTRQGRSLISILLAATAIVAIAAMPAAGMQLERVLTVRDTASAAEPELVFVLGGGYLAGETPDEDLLGSETEQRVARGAWLWHQHPSARVVLSGAAPDLGGARSPDRMATLMAAAAQRRGVPADKIVVEPRSVNTREHPIEALKIPGVRPETPIAVVTAGWHMPRARREFCRYFMTVSTSAPASSISPLSPWDFVPTAGALGGNTTLVREIAGMAWYAVRGLAGPASKC